MQMALVALQDNTHLKCIILPDTQASQVRSCHLTVVPAILPYTESIWF